MIQLLSALKNDDHGFIVSAELVLIGTIGVLALVVGLSEVANNVNQELEDVGSAIGSINQSYEVAGNSGHKGHKSGSYWIDNQDDCDGEFDVTCDNDPVQEGYHAF